jgi:hypothetical protein
MAEGSCRFPPPWRADKIPGGYVVRDAKATELEALQAKVLTKDEARRIAVNTRGCRSRSGRVSAAKIQCGLSFRARRIDTLRLMGSGPRRAGRLEPGL